MTDVNSTSTTLLDAINIGLSCIGETPVSASDNTSTNVVLAKQIIEEVSRDIQSKGWWFNTSGSNISLYANSGSGATENFSTSIPEEARRYIAIRAARVLQSRFVGSEELLKFSFQEEQVSLAILTQAHVRNGGNSTSFNSFPADLKGMGVEEVLFLQQSAEEKLLSLRLVTELKSTDKLVAETALIADQEDLVEQQVLTEVEETAKRTAEKGLVDAQKSQVQTETVLKSQQALTELQNTRKLELETDVSVAPEKAFYDGVVAGTQQTYPDFAPEMRMMGVQEKEFQAAPAYKKTELLKDANKMRTARIIPSNSSTINNTVVGTKNGTTMTVTDVETAEVNSALRLMGEDTVSSVSENALASETLLMLRDTSRELQGRGLWFNTEYDVELTPDSSTKKITIDSDVLSVEANDPSNLVYIHTDYGLPRFLYNLTDKGDTFDSPLKAKVIYDRGLHEIPHKFLEYVVLRVAMVLTEMYPQSGVDIQRLVKLEQEAETYFRDREADQVNYSVFDNYDTASRIGINRNYDIS
jgi:hypothetical protein